MKEVGACKCLLVKKVWLPMVGNVSGDERQKHFGQWRWLWTTYDCSLFWASSLAAALLHFVGGRGKTQGLTVYTWRNSFSCENTFCNMVSFLIHCRVLSLSKCLDMVLGQIWNFVCQWLVSILMFCHLLCLNLYRLLWMLIMFACMHN